MVAGNQEEEAPNLHHPFLLITDRGIGKEKKYLYSLSENRFHRANIPEFHDMEVLGSAFGWIVLANPKTDDCYMWNPRSMERIELGFFKCSDMYHRCVVSQPPSEPGFCHVMFYANYDITPAHCLLLDGAIVAPPSYQHYDSGDTKVVTAASFGGKIYCILKPGLCFSTVDFDGTTVEFTPIFKVDDSSVLDPWGMPLRNPDWLMLCADDHLIKSMSSDELLLVKSLPMCYFRSNGLEFKVFRVDVDKRECVELDNIGDRAIFVGDRADGYCCSSTSSYRRNCVYYTIPDNNKSRCVYVFDLDDRSTTQLLTCPVARRSRTTSNWIENLVSSYT